jgi:hypothetical protein
LFRLNRPDLSVILATPGSAADLELTLRYLRAQTVRGQMEIVLVGPTLESLDAAGPWLDSFWGTQRLAYGGPIASIARANALGVRHARAGLVAFAEDHCFPEPGWAEALVRAHQNPAYAVVGPVFRNANPRTLVSWCDFVIGYGPWMEFSAAGLRPFLAGHNSCYKREVLLALGASLEDKLESETVLHLELSSQGRQLYLEPAARAAHTNFAKLDSWLAVQFHAGRVFGAMRVRGFTPGRRLLYLAGCWLIPAVRWVRCAAALLPRDPVRAITILPLLAFGLLWDGAGQFAGMAFGLGEATAKVARYEFHRFRHVPAADLEDARREAPAL